MLSQAELDIFVDTVIAMENKCQINLKIDQISALSFSLMRENQNLQNMNMKLLNQLENFRTFYSYITTNCYIIQKDKCPYFEDMMEFEKMLALKPCDDLFPLHVKN